MQEPTPAPAFAPYPEPSPRACGMAVVAILAILYAGVWQPWYAYPVCVGGVVCIFCSLLAPADSRWNFRALSGVISNLGKRRNGEQGGEGQG